MSVLASLFCGFVFGCGLIVSGMTQPTKVLGFLDVFGIPSGAWDPSLAVVMAAGLTVAGIGYVRRRPSVGRQVLVRFNIGNMRKHEHAGGYAKGGKVKMSKRPANYRDSAEDNRFCARCKMHQPRNNSCTLVAGPVHRVGLCDFYEPIKKGRLNLWQN
jgi:hypothetical protein